MDETENNHRTSKRKTILVWISSGFFFAALVVFLYWFFILRFQEYTDDAYVQGNLVELTPQVSGIVASVNVDNTDYVQEGQILIELDKTDYILALEKSKNELGEVTRGVVQMFLKVEELQAILTLKEATLMQAEEDFSNRVNLVTIGAVSKEEFEHVKAALKIAESSVKETYHALEAAYAQIQGTTIETHPLVQKAIQKVKDDWMNLHRCDVLSPVNGYIAKRTAQLGEWANVKTPLLAVIPLDELWIDANFKEIQLANFRIGQKATIYSDLYGRSVLYKGKVLGINPGTGNTFSILPPQNATGNWIKIVQRVPVRISLDPKQLEKHPLWLGLSMKVTVSVQDISGVMLTECKRLKPIYQTAIYNQQLEGVEKVIQKILTQNIGQYGR